MCVSFNREPCFLISEGTNLLPARVQEGQRCTQNAWNHLGPGFRHLSAGCHKLPAQTLQHWHGLSCDGPCTFSGKWLTALHDRAHFYYILALISSLMIKRDHVWAHLSFILNIHCRFNYLSHHCLKETLHDQKCLPLPRNLNYTALSSLKTNVIWEVKKIPEHPCILFAEAWATCRSRTLGITRKLTLLL